MRQIIHRYILPPYYLVLHIVLLVPLFLPNKTDPLEPELPLLRRLSVKYAVPLGVLLYFVVASIRNIAGHFPLPQGQNRRVLAARLEWAILFAVGFVEEALRWVVVKVLVYIAGGEGGFGGMGKFSHQDSNWVGTRSVEVKSGIWEGVYLMCWIWSLLELPVRLQFSSHILFMMDIFLLLKQSKVIS